MSKGVVPHSKSYRKVGVENWMDTIERICPGFKQGSWDYARYFDEEDSSNAKTKALATVNANTRRLDRVSKMALLYGEDGRNAVDYFHYSISLEEQHAFGLWQQTRQVFRMSPVLVPEVAIDESCSIPTKILEQMPYPVMYIQLLDEETIQEYSAVSDNNGHFINKPIKVEFRHDGALVWYDEPWLSIEDFFRYRRTDADGNVEDFESDCGCRYYCVEVKKGFTFGAMLEHDRESLFTDENIAWQLARLQTSNAADSHKLPEEEGNEADLQAVRRSAETCYTEKVNLLSRVLGSLIYICSTNADMEPMYAPSPIRTGKQVRRDDTEATVTAVGYREGRALEIARAKHERELQERETVDLPRGTHRSPAPHWRRGYFGYRWCGSGEERHPELRWVSPAAVNFNKDSRNETVTFHVVKPEAC